MSDRHEDPAPVKRGDVEQAMRVAAILRNCWDIEEDGGGETPTLVEVGACPPEGHPNRAAWEPDGWSWQVHAGCGDYCPVMAEVPYDYDSDGPHRQIAEAIAQAGEVIIGLVERLRFIESEAATLRAKIEDAEEGVAAGRRAATTARELTGALLEIGRLVGTEDEAPIEGVRRLMARLAEVAPVLPPRCLMACPHGDRCRLPDGHGGGCNYGACGCNDPSRVLAPEEVEHAEAAMRVALAIAPPVLPALPVAPDPVAAVERVLGVRWVAGGDFSRIDLYEGPCGMSFADGWWYTVDGDLLDAKGDRAHPSKEPRQDASLALLRAIAAGRCFLPDGAPGLSALTAEERAAFGLEVSDG